MKNNRKERNIAAVLLVIVATEFAPSLVHARSLKPIVRSAPIFQEPQAGDSLRVHPEIRSVKLLRVTRAEGSVATATAPVPLERYTLTFHNNFSSPLIAATFRWSRPKGFLKIERFFYEPISADSEKEFTWVFQHSPTDGPIELQAVVFENGQWEGNADVAAEILTRLRVARDAYAAEQQRLRAVAEQITGRTLGVAEAAFRYAEHLSALQKDRTLDRSVRLGQQDVFSNYSEVLKTAQKQIDEGKSVQARHYLEVQAAHFDKIFNLLKEGKSK